ncbi:chorismate mutase [Bordetella sp. BOR01]|uniref:chorismate mutase n=1 Tax=Bordetella sp. BOR01 TaxID=2854779 RepID=UPI001C47BE08|nr:chorismate mutase [Bordetella sp. BOR01]MBV7482217.1 chorismate mutase [Bordetella sp. BOR01]
MSKTDRSSNGRTLEDVRRDVARIDRKIVAALAAREQLAVEAVQFKCSVADISDPALQKNLLARIDGWAIRAGLSTALARGVYTAILAFGIPRQLEVFAARHVRPGRTCD